MVKCKKKQIFTSFITKSEIYETELIIYIQHLGTGHYLRLGGSGVKQLFTENIFAAYSALKEINFRPTRRRVKIFQCLLL